MASGLLKDYLGIDVIANRPTTPVLTSGTAGYWYATDTGVLSVWNQVAGTWTNVSSGGGLNVKQAGTSVVNPVTILNFASGATVSAPGGGQADITISAGSAAWSLLTTWDFSVSGAVASVANTAITNDEVMMVGDAVTLSAAGLITAQVSTNNGTSYFTTSGNYTFIAANGTASAGTGYVLTNTSVSTARSFSGVASLLKQTVTPKPTYGTSQSGTDHFIGGTGAVNALRVIPTGGGNFNGGVIRLYGRG